MTGRVDSNKLKIHFSIDKLIESRPEPTANVKQPLQPVSNKPATLASLQTGLNTRIGHARSFRNVQVFERPSPSMMGFSNLRPQNVGGVNSNVGGGGIIPAGVYSYCVAPNGYSPNAYFSPIVPSPWMGYCLQQMVNLLNIGSGAYLHNYYPFSPVPPAPPYPLPPNDIRQKKIVRPVQRTDAERLMKLATVDIARLPKDELSAFYNKLPNKEQELICSAIAQIYRLSKAENVTKQLHALPKENDHLFRQMLSAVIHRPGAGLDRIVQKFSSSFSKHVNRKDDKRSDLKNTNNEWRFDFNDPVPPPDPIEGKNVEVIWGQILNTEQKQSIMAYMKAISGITDESKLKDELVKIESSNSDLTHWLFFQAKNNPDSLRKLIQSAKEKSADQTSAVKPVSIENRIKLDFELQALKIRGAYDLVRDYVKPSPDATEGEIRQVLEDLILSNYKDYVALIATVGRDPQMLRENIARRDLKRQSQINDKSTTELSEPVDSRYLKPSNQSRANRLIQMFNNEDEHVQQVMRGYVMELYPQFNTAQADDLLYKQAHTDFGAFTAWISAARSDAKSLAADASLRLDKKLPIPTIDHEIDGSGSGSISSSISTTNRLLEPVTISIDLTKANLKR